MVSMCSALQQIKDDPFAHLQPAMINQLAEELGHDWRDGPLDPANTVALFVQQIAAGNVSCAEVRHLARTPFSASAYCQARQRLPLKLLEEINRRVFASAHAATADQDGCCWHGHRTWLVDGTTCSMPDTPALQKQFGQPKAQKEGCGFPMTHVLAMVDLQRGLLAEPAVAPLYTSDLRHVPLMHAQMSRNDLLLGDDAFSSYAHFALLLRDGLHALMPNHHCRIVDFAPGRPHAMPGAKGGTGLPRSRQVKVLGKNDQIVEWFKPRTRPLWMSKEEYAKLPDSIQVREVRQTLGRKGLPPIQVTVVTTLLDPKQYPAAELIDLRMRRWAVEVDLRHLKTTMRMETLHCKSVAGVKKELAVFVLVYNLVRAVMLEAARRQEVAAERISFADTLHWLRHAGPGDPLPALMKVPSRPDRVEPRVLKRRPKSYGLMNKPREELREALRNPRKKQAKSS